MSLSFSRRAQLPTAAALLVLSLVPPASAAAPSDSSTGQIDSVLEPVPAWTVPTSAQPLALAEGGRPALEAGKVSTGKPRLYSWTPPPGRRFEIRLFGAEGAAAMAIYRGDSEEPSAGARPSDRTVMFMSSASGESIRILVFTERPGEVDFQLGLKVHPAEADD